MNETINIFIFIIATFFCNLLVLCCYAKITYQKIKFLRINWLILFIFTILIFLNNTYSNLFIKLFLSFFIFVAEIKLIFKNNIKQSAIGYIIVNAFLMLIEIFVTNVFMELGIMNITQASLLITVIKGIASITIGGLEYVLFSIKVVQKILNKLIETFLKYINLFNVSYLLIITVSLIGILNAHNMGSEESLKIIIIIVLIFIILFIMIIKSTAQSEILKHSNQKLMNYNKQYGKFLDEYKIYKHNMNNKLSAMKSFGNKKVNALIDELLETETNFSIRNNEIYNVPNGIKGIVAEKLYNKDYDIIIHNKLKQDSFSALNPKTFNSISECLGIALDNAIEACEETENPTIVLDIYEENDNLIIKVGNNFKNSIDIDKIGEKYYSTKNRGSGLGLFSIVRNNLVKEKITIINNIYFIELQIKKAR